VVARRSFAKKPLTQMSRGTGRGAGNLNLTESKRGHRVKKLFHQKAETRLYMLSGIARECAEISSEGIIKVK